MKQTLLALVMLMAAACGDEMSCPPPPDGGYQPGDKIVDCKEGFIEKDAK